MHVRLEAGQFGWDYRLVFSDGMEFRVQTDSDYPRAATMFGFADSPDEYPTTRDYHNAAMEWLDRHIGETRPVHPEATLYHRAYATEASRREPQEDQFEPLTPGVGVRSRQRRSLTTPLVIEFTLSGMTVRHDGSMDQEEIDRLISRPEYNALGELFGKAISNGILEWIDPEEINALTDAPLLARPEDVQRDPDDNSLIRCENVYIWMNYQVTLLVEAIFRPEGAFLFRRETNWSSVAGAIRRGRRASSAVITSRMEEVVKEQSFPLEGEWEKDER
jgi:hypothetical protein